jgi:hypothetical protein
MSWIKRNLYFVVGSLLALGLMGYGSFYLWSQYQNEQKVTAGIKELYDESTRLNKLPSSSKTDVIKQAREQEAAVRELAGKLRAHFPSPTPVPNLPKLDKRDFTKELPAAIAELTGEAQQSSVSLPKDYFFTFESQKRAMVFAPGSLEKLAVRLGEIKELCHVLFSARINALDGLKREMVSEDDKTPSDYLDQKTLVTPLGEVTPYEVTFRCFTAELAAVLSELADSQYCFVVKTINVEPAPLSAAPDAAAAVAVQPYYSPRAYDPAGTLPPGANSPPPPGIDPQVWMMRQATLQAARDAAAANPAAPARSSGPATVLNEQPLRVTLAIQLIKRKPGK